MSVSIDVFDLLITPAQPDCTYMVFLQCKSPRSYFIEEVVPARRSAADMPDCGVSAGIGAVLYVGTVSHAVRSSHARSTPVTQCRATSHTNHRDRRNAMQSDRKNLNLCVHILF